MDVVGGLQEVDVRAMISAHPPQQRYELHMLAFDFADLPQRLKAVARLRAAGFSIITIRRNGAGEDANPAFAARITFISIGKALGVDVDPLAAQVLMQERVERAFGKDIFVGTFVATGAELAAPIEAKAEAAKWHVFGCACCGTRKKSRTGIDHCISASGACKVCGSSAYLVEVTNDGGLAQFKEHHERQVARYKRQGLKL